MHIIGRKDGSHISYLISAMDQGKWVGHIQWHIVYNFMVRGLKELIECSPYQIL